MKIYISKINESWIIDRLKENGYNTTKLFIPAIDFFLILYG